jgi:hypothetical protein
MRTYKVEEVDRDISLTEAIVEAPAPFKAAEEAVRRKVTLRRGEANWIRVSELSPRRGQNPRLARVFEYVGIGPKRS